MKGNEYIERMTNVMNEYADVTHRCNQRYVELTAEQPIGELRELQAQIYNNDDVNNLEEDKRLYSDLIRHTYEAGRRDGDTKGYITGLIVGCAGSLIGVWIGLWNDARKKRRK